LTEYRVEIVDYKLAALRVMDDPSVVRAVEKAVKRLVRAANGKIDIPGVKITEVKRAA
jgi:hypothetical protein